VTSVEWKEQRKHNEKNHRHCPLAKLFAHCFPASAQKIIMVPGTFFYAPRGDEVFTDRSPFGSRVEFLYTGDTCVKRNWEKHGEENPNIEIRNPKQIQMIKKLQCSKRGGSGSDFGVLEFSRFWIYLVVSLFWISIFGFRVLFQ